MCGLWRAHRGHVASAGCPRSALLGHRLRRSLSRRAPRIAHAPQTWCSSPENSLKVLVETRAPAPLRATDTGWRRRHHVRLSLLASAYRISTHRRCGRHRIQHQPPKPASKSSLRVPEGRTGSLDAMLGSGTRAWPDPSLRRLSRSDRARSWLNGCNGRRMEGRASHGVCLCRCALMNPPGRTRRTVSFVGTPVTSWDRTLSNSSWELPSLSHLAPPSCPHR